MTGTIDPATICRQLTAADRRARDLVAGLTEQQATWRPSPASPSILDCLFHVARSAERALADIDEGLARAPRVRPYLKSSRELGWLWRLFLKAWELSTPVQLSNEPDPSPPVRHVLADLLRMHDEVRSRIARIFRCDLEATRMSLPTAWWLRLPLGVGLAAIPVHARRQLRRAERVRLDPRFPAQ